MPASGWESVIDEYLRDCGRRGLRPATVRYYRLALTRIGADRAFASAADLTIASVRAFQDDPADLGAASVRGYLRALKTFARGLVDEGQLAADPLARLRLPRVDSKEVITPNDAELVALLRAAAPPLRTVLALFAGTGLRVGDVARLDVGGHRPGQLHVPTTKNRTGRLVLLDPVLDALLARHTADAGLRAGPLFLTRTGRRMGDDAVRHALSDAEARAQLEIHVSPTCCATGTPSTWRHTGRPSGCSAPGWAGGATS